MQILCTKLERPLQLKCGPRVSHGILVQSWQFRTRLHLVPLAPIQTEIRLHCPDNLRVVLYRRFMVRIAERIARARK